jgi:hypothetical protein
VNLPADLHRLAPIAAIGIVAVVATLLVVRGLGGSEAKRPAPHRNTTAAPARALDQTFAGAGASSGRFEATAALALDSAPSPAANPFTLEAAGAFQRGTPGAPAFELDATTSAVGQKQSFRLVSNGQRAALTTGGRSQPLPAGSGTTSFALSPRGWLTKPVDAGTAQVGGVETTHVSADVDVTKMFRDLQAAARPSSAAARTAIWDEAQSLRDSVRNVKAQIYTGASDHVLRRVTVTGTVRGGGAASASTAAGRFVFDLRITDIGKAQSIEAPVRAAPRPAPKHAARTHAPPKRPSSSKQATRHRSAKGYLNCVQGAQDLQALQRCQALLPSS